MFAHTLISGPAFTNGTAQESIVTPVGMLAEGGTMTLGGVGETNSEDLTFDFETTANIVRIGSSSGLIGTRYVDLLSHQFGSSGDSRFYT